MSRTRDRRGRLAATAQRDRASAPQCVMIFSRVPEAIFLRYTHAVEGRARLFSELQEALRYKRAMAAGMRATRRTARRLRH